MDNNNNIIYNNNNNINIKPFFVNNFFSDSYFIEDNNNNNCCIINNNSNHFVYCKHLDEKCSIINSKFNESWNSKKLIKDGNGFEIECDDDFTLKDLNGWCSNIKINFLDLKIAMINIQHLNIKNQIKLNKLKWLQNVCREIKPDFLFVMDLGINENLDLINYFKYTSLDGNNLNMLFVHYSLNESFDVIDNCFVNNNLKMCFSYLIPNYKNMIQADKLVNFCKKKFALYGDFNLRSNKDFRNKLKIISLNGEETLQTVVINEMSCFKAGNFVAPSDHNLVFFSVKRLIHNTNKVRVSSIKCEYNFVSQIFDGENPTIKNKINIQKNKIDLVNGDIVDNILSDVLNNDIRKAYDFYGRLWRNKRREPFLGTKVPNRIINDFKVKFEHDDNKVYEDIPYNINEISEKDIGEPEIKLTKSKAVNFEGNSLSGIAFAVKIRFTKLTEVDDFNDSENEEDFFGDDNEEDIDNTQALRNFFNYVNKNKNNLICKTFFLMKNKLLRDARDVRIIVIMPTVIKILESLIYVDIFSYLSELINMNNKYQFGGTVQGSCFEAFYLMNKRYNYDKGIMLIDFVRGYDSIIWDFLKKFVEMEVSDSRMKKLLNIWIVMAKNMDYEMSGSIVKKRKGIAMGLSLSPIIFDFYVHCVFKNSNIQTNDKVMYIDDLAWLITKDMSIEDFNLKYLDLEENCKAFGLIINRNKTSMLSECSDLISCCSGLNISANNKEKYLGAKLQLVNNEIKPNIANYYDNVLTEQNAYFSSLLLQRLILIGGLDAKLRYACMMIPIENKELRKRLWQKQWFFFKKEFGIISYFQVSFMCWNLFRFCINPNVLEDIFNKLTPANIIESENLIKSYLITGIEQVDKVINEFSLDLELTLEAITMCSEFLNFSTISATINNWWEKFCIGFAETWKNQKLLIKDYVLYSDIVKIIRCKFFVNSRLMQDFIFFHVPKFSIFSVIDEFLNIRKKENIWYIVINFIDLLADFVDGKTVRQFNLKEVSAWSAKFAQKWVYKGDINNRVDYVRYFDKLFREAQLKIFKIADAFIVLEEKGKQIFKELYKKLMIIDIFYNDKKFFNMGLDELDYLVDYKLRFALDNIKNIIDCEEELDNYYSVTKLRFWSNALEKVYRNNIISVDGSYKKDGQGIGIGILLLNNGHEEKFFACYKGKRFKKFNNITGELFGTIIGLKLAMERNWCDINLIYDYIGIGELISGRWTGQTDIACWFVKQYNLIKNAFSINLWKASSHTSVRLNEIADELANLGADDVQPFDGMIKVQIKNYVSK